MDERRSAVAIAPFSRVAVAEEWRRPDLNRRHHGFQPCALPTELPRRAAQCSRTKKDVRTGATASRTPCTDQLTTAGARGQARTGPNLRLRRGRDADRVARTCSCER